MLLRVTRPMLIGIALAMAMDAIGGDPVSYEAFMKLPYEEREARIRELSLEAQVDAYLEMVYVTEPPNDSLASIIAPGGPQLARIVRVRIETDLREQHRVDLIDLIWVMHGEGFIDVRADSSFLALLERVASETRGDVPREIIGRKVDDIRTLKSGWIKARREEREERLRDREAKSPAE